jgi:HSP20 family protein
LWCKEKRWKADKVIHLPFIAIVHPKHTTMSLVNWNPQKSFFPNLNNWAEEFFPGAFDWFPSTVKSFALPAVNVKENNKEFILEIAAPGFQKDQIKVEVEHGYLMISGENKVERKRDEGETTTRQEFNYSKFSRSFRLPGNVDTDKIAASFKDGLLTMSLPKNPQASHHAKAVEIK